MRKLDLLEIILKQVKTHNISAYEIAKHTNLSTAGLQKILNGETKNPNSSTLLKIAEYLENSLVGTNLPLSQVNEPKETYLKTNEVIDFLIENTDELLKNKKFAAWYEGIKLRAENEILRSLNK